MKIPTPKSERARSSTTSRTNWIRTTHLTPARLIPSGAPSVSQSGLVGNNKLIFIELLIDSVAPLLTSRSVARVSICINNNVAPSCRRRHRLSATSLMSSDRGNIRIRCERHVVVGFLTDFRASEYSATRISSAEGSFARRAFFVTRSSSETYPRDT